MAKQNRVKRPRKKQTSQALIPEQYRDAAYCGLLILSLFVFFHEAIFGGGFLASDNLASLSFKPFLDKAAADGEFPHWVPYIFSGFPGYPAQLITGDRWWDLISNLFFGLSEFIGAVFSSDVARICSFYMLYAVGMYLLMRQLKHERIAAFFTAFAATYVTMVIAWVMIGHNTKPIMVMTFPYIFICILKLREKFSILYTALLMVVIHILFDPGRVHHQLVFYALLALTVYYLYYIVHHSLRKETAAVKGLLRSGLILLSAGLLAFVMGSDRYLANLEYLEYSTRGSAPIIQSVQAEDESSADDGDYIYATSYSFDPAEISTFFVPNFFGFGRLEYSGPELSEPTKLPTYWGTKPISDAANYFGIGVLFLAGLGIYWYWRRAFVRYLVIISALALLLSFGSHFPLLYDAFYYLVPGFKSFRAPETILVIFQFAFVILAGFGLSGVIRLHEEGPDTAAARKPLLYALFAAVGFLLLAGLFAALFADSYKDAVAVGLERMRYPQSIIDFVFDAMIKDWVVTAFVAIGFMLSALLFVSGKLSRTPFYIVTILLLVFDLWRVDARPMDVAETRLEQSIRENEVIRFLKQDQSLFRVADFQQQNQMAYFFQQNIHGYSSAKLRIYQDMIDVAGQGGTSFILNPFLWNLLNVKYIISPQQMPGLPLVLQAQRSGEFVYENPSMLPRAFFVDRAERADSAIHILNHLRDGDFNPRELAYFETEPPPAIEPPGPDASAEVVDFQNHSIKLKVNASGNNLLFLSEVYYPVCWKAYIDGQPTEIYKTNYVFRSILVPPGEHEVEFRYEANWEWTIPVSLITNILILGLVAVGVVMVRKSRKNDAELSGADDPN